MSWRDPERFDPQIHTLDYFRRECEVNEETLLWQRLAEAKLTDEQMARVLWAVFYTCPHCWDNDTGCHCWNDE